MDKSKKITFAGLLLFPLFSLFIFNTFILNDFSFKKERQPEVYLGEPGKGELSTLKAEDPDKITVLLEAKQITTQKNTNFSVDLVLNTKGKTVGDTKIILDFNPEYLELKQVLAGPIFSRPNIKKTNTQVVIKAEENIVGKGEIATLYFNAKKSGQTELKTSNDSSVLNDKGKKKESVFNRSLITID